MCFECWWNYQGGPKDFSWWSSWRFVHVKWFSACTDCFWFLWQCGALSQHGRIDSHAIHATEVFPDGTYDDSEFRDNMEYAACNVVHRISGVPYAGNKFYSACPACDTHCATCGKKGHWAKLSLCGQKGDGLKQKSGKPQTLSAITAAVRSHKVPNVRVTVGGFVVNGADITAMPDTGADVTVSGLYVLTVLKIDVANIQDSAIPLKAADNHKIGQIGEFTATISCGDFSTEEVIQVIDGTKGLYLSWHASQKLAFVPSDYPTQIMSRDMPDPTRDTFDTTAAATDDEYHDLIRLISDGFPHSRQDLPPLMRPYWSARDQLSIDEDSILCGCRLLIPHPLRREVLRTLHSSHQGIERTKRCAHLAVYWPGINNEIDQVVSGCRECSAELPSQPKEPLQSHDIPERVFQHLCCDCSLMMEIW